MCPKMFHFLKKQFVGTGMCDNDKYSRLQLHFFFYKARSEVMWMECHSDVYNTPIKFIDYGTIIMKMSTQPGEV